MANNKYTALIRELKPSKATANLGLCMEINQSTRELATTLRLPISYLKALFVQHLMY